MIQEENTLTEVFVTSKICYNFGAAMDILNPLIHTNCETMICIDLKDDYYYNRYITASESHLPIVINRLIAQINNLNKQRRKITDTFEDINVVLLEETKFIINMTYKNIVRNIIYYVGDGNEFIPPEIEDAKKNNTLECIWWSMSCITKQTIDYLNPKCVVVVDKAGTRIDNQLNDYTFSKTINTIRINCHTNKIKISNVTLSIYNTL